LAGLDIASLTDEQLESAFQTAQQLDVGELAGKFAKALVGRPAHSSRTDRYPWYAHLTQLALAEGDTTAALNWVDDGERADCEHNEGRRRNDFELRRGQVLAKQGDAARAQEVFESLIARVPNELKFAGSAAEAMLAMKQPARALQFAEKGLAGARTQNNRDSEEYFKELTAAARKQGA
jgi:predicted Zn-dependent protease